MAGGTNLDRDLGGLLERHSVPKAIREAFKDGGLFDAYVFAQSFTGQDLEKIVEKHGFRKNTSGDLTAEDDLRPVLVSTLVLA